MVKRNCFVILAGLITGAALLGWSPKIEGALTGAMSGKSDGNAAEVEKQNIAKAGEFSAKVSEALDTLDGERLAVMAQLAEDGRIQDIKGGGTAVPLKLLNPDVAPDLDAGEPVKISLDPLKDALKALQKSDDLNPNIHLAVFDFAGKKILESDNADAALAQVEKFLEASELEAGTFFMNEEDGAVRLMWKCLDEDKTRCIFASEQRDMELDKSIKCGAVQNGMLTCGEENVELVSIFGKGACSMDDSHKAVMEALVKNIDKSSGMFKVGEKEFAFTKADLKAGCVLSLASPIEESKDGGGAMETLTKSRIGSFSLLALGMSLVGTLIIIVLGLIMTKRKKENVVTEPANQEQPKLNGEDENKKLSEENAKKLKEAQENLAKLNKENEELRKQVEALNAEVEDSGKTDAIPAPSESVVAAAPVASAAPSAPAPAAPSAPAPAAPSAPAPAAPSAPAQAAPSAPAASSAPAAPATPAAPAASATPGDTANASAPAEDKKNIDVKGRQEADEFFDALEKDNWDELAIGFESIQSPRTGEEPVLDEATVNAIGQTEKKAAEDVSAKQGGQPKVGGLPGMKSLKSSMSPSGAKTTLPGVRSVDSPVISKSVAGEGVNATMPVKAPTFVNGMPVFEEQGKEEQKPAEEKKPGLPGLKPSSLKLPSKPIAGKSGGGIAPAVGIAKPNPGNDVNTSVVDQDVLYDALKKHAKDVSEVNPVVSEAGNSGAFEFNKGISKSESFSMTGSRVDIDPASDNEYFKSVYDKFVETQQSCGEQTKFTLEQFMTRLSREKERLMKTYNCKTVRFNVYIKEGKTSLKAVPQK